MTESAIEEKLRSFLVEELAKEQAQFFGLDDELELDSLDQTELRSYLTEEFRVDTSFDKIPPESLSTINQIMKVLNAKLIAT